MGPDPLTKECCLPLIGRVCLCGHKRGSHAMGHPHYCFGSPGFCDCQVFREGLPLDEVALELDWVLGVTR